MSEEKLQSVQSSSTDAAPVVDIPEGQAHIEGSYAAHDGINGDIHRDT